MPNLFSDLPFGWTAKSAARSLRRMQDAGIAPFRVLNRIHWAAPWEIRQNCCCGAK